MIAYLDRDQHFWLKRFLSEHQGTATWLARTGIEVFAGPAGTAMELGLVQEVTRLSTPDAIAGFRSELEKLGSVSLMDYQLGASPGQMTSATTTGEIPYIEDYELLLIEPDQVLVGDPVIGLAKNRTALYVRAVKLGRANYGLQFGVSLSHYEQPFAKKVLRFGAEAGQAVEVQVPEEQARRLGANLAVADGDLVILATTLDDGSERIFVAEFDAQWLDEVGGAPAALDPVRSPQVFEN